MQTSIKDDMDIVIKNLSLTQRFCHECNSFTCETTSHVNILISQLEPGVIKQRDGKGVLKQCSCPKCDRKVKHTYPIALREVCENIVGMKAEEADKQDNHKSRLLLLLFKTLMRHKVDKEHICSRCFYDLYAENKAGIDRMDQTQNEEKVARHIVMQFSFKFTELGDPFATSNPLGHAKSIIEDNNPSVAEPTTEEVQSKLREKDVLYGPEKRTKRCPKCQK